MITRITVLAAALAALLAPASALAGPAANKALVLKVVRVLFNAHQVDKAFDAYFDPGYIQHDPMAPTGAAAARAFFKKFYAANPNASAKVSHVLAEGDLVAVHYLFRIKPEDRGFAVVDIFRIAHHRIAEHWDVVQPVPEKSANDNGML